MRVWKRSALALGVAAGAAVLWSGCQAKKQTEYVAGVSTQVQVPRDLKTIRVDVNVGGVPVFCRAYKVYDGRVQLPRSLGSFPNSDGHLGDPLTVSVVGFTEDLADDTRQDEYQCLKQISAGQNARILRRSRQPYVLDEILFLPLALRFSCFDKDCETAGQDKTCKGGRCVDATTDEKTLPKYSDDLLDGTGGACFHAATCLGAAEPAVLVNPDDCTFALPGTVSSPPILPGLTPLPNTGDGVNVTLAYDGGLEREVLDKDLDEGFVIPDPTKPQQFRLAGGLCDLFKGVDVDGNPTAHRITGVFTSGTCQSKGKFQPICKDDQLKLMGLDASGVSPKTDVTEVCKPAELKPPNAVLMVLADDTSNSEKFFRDQSQGLPAVNLALGDPAFRQTQLALMFFPGPPAGGTAPQCTSPTTRPFDQQVPPGLASKTKAAISNAFATAQLGGLNAQTDLDGALGAAYTTLADPAYSAFYRRAVLVIGNRGFDVSTCGDPVAGLPVALATDAHNNKSIDTWVVAITPDTGAADPTAPLPFAFNALAAAGRTNGFPYDGRTAATKGAAQQALRDIVNDLATCVYDVGAPLKTDQVLSFSDPTDGSTHTVAFDTACNADGASASGWGVDKANANRIHVCGAKCDEYRGVLVRAAAYSNQYLQPALAVPMFAHTAKCAPAPGGGTAPIAIGP